MNCRALLQWAVAQLVNSESAHLDAELLMCHLLKIDRVQLRLLHDSMIDSVLIDEYRQLVSERKKGIPIAYLVGYQSFWSFDLMVTPNVLIPRPETELIVETILKEFDNSEPRTVLDLGTGSGAIAIALAFERKNWKVIATDFSEAALKVAKQNSEQLVLHNIQFLLGYWFEPFTTETFDIIVSNPPYVDKTDPLVTESDIRFEPITALCSNEAGLADIRAIVFQAKQFLKTGGKLIIEHGFQQGSAVRALFHEAHFSQVETLVDLAGLERITIGTD